MHGFIDPGERRLPDGVFETDIATMPTGPWNGMPMPLFDTPLI